MKRSKPGYVYIFGNPSFPEWVKIGKTGDWKRRLRNGNTYTPFNFYPIAIFKTSDMGTVEKSMHDILRAPESSHKEFFEIEPKIAVNDLLVIAKNRMDCDDLSGFVVYKLLGDQDYIPDYKYDSKCNRIKIKIKTSVRDKVFHSAKRGSRVRMRIDDDNHFVVLKGSVLEPMTEALRNSGHPARVSIRNDRQRLERDRKKVKGLKLLCDVSFKSSSRALEVMLGCSAMQGPSCWLDDAGKPLAKYL